MVSGLAKIPGDKLFLKYFPGVLSGYLQRPVGGPGICY